MELPQSDLLDIRSSTEAGKMESVLAIRELLGTVGLSHNVPDWDFKAAYANVHTQLEWAREDRT
jgi:hypothetical protein